MGRSRFVIERVCALLAVFAAPPATAQVATLARETTTVRSYDGRSMSAEILRLQVPERRPQTGQITVAALRFPATAERQGTPIVFLMGGPGIPGSAMARVPPYFTLFQRLRETADVIVLDQRGIGLSTPALDCPVTAPLPDSALLAEGPLVAFLEREVAACAESWRRRGADPTAYTTVESAADVDDLRTALGLERVDLLAFSYGTRLALAVAQRHGAHVGRMVLQGVNGPGLVLKRPVAIARKLRIISETLASDSAWPPTDLVAAARQARARLTASAAALTITDRRTGRPMTVSVGRYGFDVIVSSNLDDARLPALLVSVAAGDDRVLRLFVEGLWNGLAGGNVGLMARAVNCAADRPPSRMALIAREAEQAPFGHPLDNAVLTDGYCAAVGFRTPPVEFPAPLHSAVPALLMTGTLDATNPAENAADVARGLSQAVQLDIHNAAHEALPLPAVQDAVLAFLRGEDVRARRVANAVPRFPTVAAALAEPSQPRR